MKFKSPPISSTFVLLVSYRYANKQSNMNACCFLFKTNKNICMYVYTLACIDKLTTDKIINVPVYD